MKNIKFRYVDIDSGSTINLGLACGNFIHIYRSHRTDKMHLEVGGYNVSTYGTLDKQSIDYLESESGITFPQAVWAEIKAVLLAASKGSAALKDLLEPLPVYKTRQLIDCGG